MRALDSVLLSYKAAVDSLRIVSPLLQRSSKPQMFHGTVFHGELYTQIQVMMGESIDDLYDLFIVLLVASFEHVLFKHPSSPLQDDPPQWGAAGVKAAITFFQKDVPVKLYEEITQLCVYRDWVAHGKRWETPAQPGTPDMVCQQLTDFLIKAKIIPISSHAEF